MNVTIFIVGFGGIYIFLKIIGFFDDDDTVPPQKVSPNISSTSYSNNKNSRSKETFQNSSPSTATKSSDELSECIDALLLQNFRLALDTVLNSLKDLLSNFKEHNEILERPCITLEYCSLILFLSDLGASKTNYSADQLNAKIAKDLTNICILNKSHIEQYMDTYIDVAAYLESRKNDYKKIFFGSYEPCGYYLLNDYPRLKDKTEDGLNRCGVALGDFSLCWLNYKRIPIFEDLDPVIVLDLFDMPNYSQLFLFIKQTATLYYKNYIGIASNPAGYISSI